MRVSEEQIELAAYEVWLRTYEFFKDFNDFEVRPFLNIENTNSFWLKKTRESLQMSIATASKRAKVTAQAYEKFEAREELGAINLATMKRVAEALDCDFIYALRPRSKKLISEVIWAQLLPIIKREKKFNDWTWFYRANAMAELAADIFNDALFRRSQNWSERGVRRQRTWEKADARTKVISLLNLDAPHKNKGLSKRPLRDF